MSEFDGFGQEEPPSLQSIVDVGAIQPAEQIERPEYVPDMKDEPQLASEHEELPWNKPASRGGHSYPGRPAPSGTVEFEGKQCPVVRNCSLTEEEYVRREVEITKTQLLVGMIKGSYMDKDGKTVDDREARLQRCETYARWRYRGFLSGQVASL